MIIKIWICHKQNWKSNDNFLPVNILQLTVSMTTYPWLVNFSHMMYQLLHLILIQRFTNHNRFSTSPRCKHGPDSAWSKLLTLQNIKPQLKPPTPRKVTTVITYTLQVQTILLYYFFELPPLHVLLWIS